MNLAIDPRLALPPGGKSLQAAATAAQTKDHTTAGLQHSCAEFEAVLVQQLFKTMRGANAIEGLIDTGTAGEIYQELLDGEVASQLAHHQSLGIGTNLYRQLAQGG
ncbi:rod-binding protein [Desulfuromonas thiophila]|jgi:flagellar protein FlgJ|uniref:Flagellar protein FlgJ n=1 Tax=Desulfuromonas thiophila TaxID=57664 RepID=A0A1G7BJM2_9BACT|nr:rod-binding protein [Desulfuromonas thiophila]MCK9172927.1 rod-binding protein [Desulfuromonas thiophila]MDD3801195.1 rod-binding protein [Desulfuromonas thiophila]MDY0397192.1 rod-binding protein [Desulfuromonas thiophila]SDE26626.1 flagellar protein FlgJ [Desulfuromonas thiophila]